MGCGTWCASVDSLFLCVADLSARPLLSFLEQDPSFFCALAFVLLGVNMAFPYCSSFHEFSAFCDYCKKRVRCFGVTWRTRF